MMRKLSPQERLELLQIYFSARTEKELCEKHELNVSALCKSRGISRNTFYHWKKRFEQKGHSGLFDRPAGRKRWKRFEMKEPDEMWQIDHSRSDFDGKWRFVILDDHSRMVLCCAEVASLGSEACCALLVQTIKKFVGRRQRKLLSNNHASFRSRAFKGLLQRLGIQAVHSRVHHPQTLGKVERFNRTFQENAWLFSSP